MRSMKEHIVWATTRDEVVVCVAILEDVDAGEFFPVHFVPAFVGAAEVHYNYDGNYSEEEGEAIANAGAVMRRSLGSYWSTLASVDDPLKANSLKEAVRKRLS